MPKPEPTTLKGYFLTSLTACHVELNPDTAAFSLYAALSVDDAAFGLAAGATATLPVAGEAAESGATKADVDLDFQTACTPFPLAEDTLTALLGASVTVEVYKARTPEEVEAGGEDGADALLGSVALPLMKVFSQGGGAYKTNLALGTASLEGGDSANESPLWLGGSTSFVTLSVAPVDELADYIRGGTVLSFAAPAIGGVALPASWLLSPEALAAVAVPAGDEGYKAAVDEALAAGDAGTAAFTLTWRLYEPTPLAGTPVPVVVRGGALALDADAAAAKAALDAASAAAADAAAAAGEDADDAEALAAAAAEAAEAAAAAPPAFAVRWPAGASVYLSKRSKKALKEALDTGATLDAVVERALRAPVEPEPAAVPEPKGKKGAPAAPAEPVEAKAPVEIAYLAPCWTGACALDLSGLAAPGATSAVAAAAALAGAAAEGDAAADAAADADADADAAAAASAPAGEVAVEASVSSALSLVPAADIFKGLLPADVVPPRRVGPKRPPRDFSAELRGELDDIVESIATEFTKLFPKAAPGSEELPREEQEKQLLFSLNTSGLYHMSKEALKPRIQRVIRNKFSSAPKSADEADRFTSQLYAMLMEETNAVLNSKFRASELLAEPDPHPEPFVTEEKLKGRSSAPAAAKCQLEMEKLLTLAEDAEASGQRLAGKARHEDRVHKAMLAAESGEAECAELVKSAWRDFGAYMLRAKQPLDAAVEALQSAVAYGADGPADADGTLALLGAALLEQGAHERSEVFLRAAVVAGLAPGASEASFDDADLLATSPLCNALLCLFFDKVKKPFFARKALRTASSAWGAQNEGRVADGALGTPVRTPGQVLLEAADFLLSHGLNETAARALEMAAGAEAAAKAKAAEYALVDSTAPVAQRALGACLRARLLLAGGDPHAAQEEAEAATAACPEDAVAWSVLGDAHLAAGASSEAVDAYTRAVGAWPSLSPVPLRWYVRLGSACLTLGRHKEARDIFLQCCEKWEVASCWLWAGVAMLRMGDLVDTEDALQEANLRDHRSPQAWGYLSLCSLRVGGGKMEQAGKAMDMALQLGLTDAGLLRELGAAYVAYDRLETAEMLYRRSLAADGSATTRRMLADCLRARNAGDQAVEEYRQVLASGVGGAEGEKARAALEEVLKSLGREEEIVERQ